MKRFYFVLSLFIIMFTACDVNRIFENHESIPEYVWDKKDAMEYTVSIPSSTQAYNILIAVRHASFYSYSDVPIIFSCTGPAGEEFMEPIVLQLSDENKDWLAECMGQICDLEIEVKKNIIFSNEGDYNFQIQLNTQDQKVAAIMEIGLIVEKATGK